MLWGTSRGGHTYTCLVYLGPVRTFTWNSSLRIDVSLIFCILKHFIVFPSDNASICGKRCFGKGHSCRDA